jgi:hypothetical protein
MLLDELLKASDNSGRGCSAVDVAEDGSRI